MGKVMTYELIFIAFVGVVILGAAALAAILALMNVKEQQDKDKH